ncbi:hypothetical protein LXA47_02610 [Massilia sp. P8910]|uniref:hypothetical protein n=1 Tax=Massilia antarctica TaxID=2765360 RepID=UPI001E54DEAC|nr:hypothetical protein [Massilia antarctica]MCE3602496.1 hypothetical protein [Massilia antarctica]
MPLPIRLILFPFLQSYDGNALALRLLAAPQTDPTAAPAPGLTPFVTTDFQFELRFVADPAQLPTSGAAATIVDQLSPAPPGAAAICAALDAQFGIDASVGPIDGRAGAPRIVKYAPPAYRRATGYGGENPFLLTDDSYHCALKAPIPAGTSVKATPPVISWGKVLAQVLRQPLLAEASGLVRPFTVIAPADIVAAGGWLFVTLKAGSPWSALAGTPGALRSYAARIAPLGAPRPLFTPVLFPVADAPAPGVAWDDLFRESIEYDDGFAKAVYARQPPQADPLADAEGEHPPEDRGIQLGWDDEQIVTWFNRQFDIDADAPMGVMGYRVDVREAGTVAWESLVRAHTAVTLGASDLGDLELDWRVEVAPNRITGDTGNRSWLPSYMSAWTGPSLIGVDALVAQLRGLPAAAPAVQGLAPATALRYGRSYEFRVRFNDLTGGGPAPNDEPRNGGPQPVAGIDFRRPVRPAGVAIDPALPLDANAAAPPSTLTVSRPLLGYPSCLMAGGSQAALLADIAPAMLARRAPGLPDPDVDQLEIVVEVGTPEPGAASRYLPLYTVTRAYPDGAPLTLDFAWTDVADARDLAAAAAGPLALPTSRNVRLRLTPLAATRADYYASETVRRGETRLVALRAPASDERGLLVQGGDSLIEGFFLQPAEPISPAMMAARQAAGHGDELADDPLGRLAAALDLDRKDRTLRARRGRRLMIGAGALLRQVVGPDGASLTFATANDMTRLWLVAVVLELRRDWSWDGLDYLRIERDGVEVGRIAASTSAGHEAAGDAERDSSTLVFLDAIDPKPAAGAFPRPLTPSYRITPVLRIAPSQQDVSLEAAIVLPVTTPPAQVPRLVSAGLALSPYRRDPAYAASEERQTAVWLEFDGAPLDPEDRYYARVLASAPDPVLINQFGNVAAIADLPLPVDPEPLRRIVPGQGDDRAGQASMQLLAPTSSARHFLLPLPPGLTPGSLELFGFFTYEFRVGHAGIWSTAQGFAGRALRVAGIQHAPPPLACAVTRSKGRLTVSAAFADPVRDGRSLRPAVPVTDLWALLYARVHQADDLDRRNILLGTRRLDPARRQQQPGAGAAKAGADGMADWSSAEISAGLALLTLGPDAPLSCLVVETLPGEEPYPDPLAAQLGYERFLRTSPLTEVPEIC